MKETLDSALDPVIAERLKAAAESLRRSDPAAAAKVRAAQIAALLAIRVCDSACGSGHFLLAAARRIGRALAQVATGEDEPSPEAVRHWTREAIIHCIYGVDKNPLAVDLCKVALWIEGHSEGKPLTFLDAHIKCGDSLVGVFDLKVLDAGIPDEAFDPVTGDDKAVARELKRRNKQERGGQLGMVYQEEQAALDEAVRQWQAQLDSPEDTPAQVRQKQAAYRKLQQQEDAQRTACDLWTAAFFMPADRRKRRRRRHPDHRRACRTTAASPPRPIPASSPTRGRWPCATSSSTGRWSSRTCSRPAASPSCWATRRGSASSCRSRSSSPHAIRRSPRAPTRPRDRG